MNKFFRAVPVVTMVSAVGLILMSCSPTAVGDAGGNTALPTVYYDTVEPFIKNSATLITQS